MSTISATPASLLGSVVDYQQQVNSMTDSKSVVRDDSEYKNSLIPALVTVAACAMSIASGVASATPITISIDTPTYFSPNLILNEERLDLELIGRIREINSYDENWDGQQAMKASPSSISAAEEFVKQLSAIKGILKPNVSLAADGEIGFFWKQESFILDLGINEDGTYSYYAKLGGGKELFNDEVMVSAAIPAEIVELISA